jgi:hypothetical protein
MRQAERHNAHGLSSPQIGDLVDLSISGMRCKCDGKPKVVVGQRLPLLIQNEGQSIRVNGIVVWVRRMSLAGSVYQMGVRFIDVRPGITKALEQFAKYGCINMNGAVMQFDAEGGVESGSGTQPSPDSAAKPAAKPVGSSESSPQPVTGTVEIENLYEHLGIEIASDDTVVRKAYHQLAMKYHPDRCSDPQSAAFFAIINKSYSVLKDPERRKRYDQMLRASLGILPA